MSDRNEIASAGGAVEMPGFRLLFPPGWTKHDATEESERELLARSRAKIKNYARPDLDFTLTSSIKTAFRQLRSQDGIAMYLPTDVDERSILPMSMTASRLLDPAGAPLDSHIAAVIKNHDGGFLGDDHQIVRWRRTHRRLEGMPGAVNQQINYAIPVAGTARRMALLLSTSILQDTEQSVDDDSLTLMIELSDSIVGTFTWESSLVPATRRD